MARYSALALVPLSLATALCLTQPLAAQKVHETNLVTDDQSTLTGMGFTPAAFVDPHLINPWGVSYGPTSPFWVSNQGSNTSTLYNGAGSPIPLVVAIPHGDAAPFGPTGQVFNGGTGFVLSNGSSARFIFANLDGSISGWNGAAGTTAIRAVPTSDGRASYTGLALGTVGSNQYLYAPNRETGKIDVFDSSFAHTTLTGNFTDPGPNPAGLIPFNVSNIGGHLWVTYSIAGDSADEADLGSGFVSEFNLDGTFVQRLTEGGPLSSPWGLAIAPSTFGALAGSLLVGNFSDEHGQINAFSLADGSWMGALLDEMGNPLTIPYLWALTPGNGGNGGSPSSIYFTAGIGDEEHGLFGRLDAAPEPASWAMMLLGFAAVGGTLRNRRKAATDPVPTP